MADLESTMQWKVDISQFTRAMQEAKKALQTTNSEFKMTTSTMDKWSNNTAGIEAKVKQLGNTLEAEKRILQIYNKAWEEAKKTFGETSPEAERLAKQVENQQIKINKTQVQLEKYNSKLNEMQKEQKEAGTASGTLNAKIEEQEKKLGQLKTAYKDAVLQYGKNSKEAKELAKQIEELSGELKENKTQMENADKAADELDKSMDDLNDSAKSVGDGFTVLKGALANLVAQGMSKVIQGVKDLARETFNAGANFESSMSNVAAISGAAGDEILSLAEKAEEMGSRTKFTASEAADAFSYMAMAGWKTEDMLNGIEGIMNLAAASGADLATTSDIVTDALTAMGYGAKDAGRLADVMAAASSNANTNVEMMGQTFQYAAPIVGALGYSMEDTAVAIGLMANAGIKGEKAGTALRSVLTRLSAPPKECADAMSELGLSLTDSEGNMKDMNEVIGDLRKAFDGLSETEQTTFAKHIAGQEAMSGLLAIVRAAPEDFLKLSLAVENSAGAAEHMAEVMNDNVSGQITLLKSKIEGIMIKVFEKASKSIRKSIDTISDSLDKIDWDKFADGVGDAAEKITDFFSFVARNGNTIVSILQTVATAFVTYKAVSTITSVHTAFTNLFSAVKAGQGIMQTFNTVMGMNPYALVAAGIAALVIAVGKYSEKQYEALEAEYGLSEAQKKSIERSKELAQSYLDMKEARANSISDIHTEYDYLHQLKDEYNNLVDSNGKVKEGYESRANFILNQLASAMGMEVEKIKEIVDENGKLGESIDKVIQKRQAEAVLATATDDYNRAIRERKTVFEDLVKAQDSVSEAEAKYKKHLDENGNALGTYLKLVEENVNEADKFYQANSDVINQQISLKSALDAANGGLGDAETAWVELNATIKNYEGLSAAIISEDVEAINDGMRKLQEGFITAETGTREALEGQVKTYEKSLADLKLAINKGTPSVTQEMVDQAQAMVDAAKLELDKLAPEASEKGITAGKNFADGVGSQADNANLAGNNIGSSANTGAETGASPMNTTGSSAGEAFAKGVDSQAENANIAGDNVGKNANTGAVKGSSPMNQSGTNAGTAFVKGVDGQSGNSNKAGVNVGSNANTGAVTGSSPMNQSGTNAGSAFVSGVNSQSGNANKAGNTIGKSADTGANTGSKPMNATGSKAGGQFVSGVNSKQSEANSAGNNLGNQAKSGADSVDASSSGSNFASGFLNGIGGWISAAWNKGWELARAAWDGLRAGQSEGSPSKLTRKSGEFFGEGYELGIGDMVKPVTDAASNLALKAVDALRDNMNEEMFQIGADSGQNLIDGMNGIIPNVSGAITELKSGVVSANAGMTNAIPVNVGSFESGGDHVQNVTFNQYNNSPKALDRLSVYRETNSLLFSAKVRLQNV